MSSLSAFHRLVARGFSPKVIYDVGAHEGVWAKEAMGLFPSARLYLFEADLDKHEVLRPFNAFFEVFSSKDDEEIVFYKTKGRFTTGNSFMRELSVHYTGDNFYKETRKTKTLETLVKTHELELPDLIKLDTQGSELKILEGFPSLFNKSSIIYLEVSLHQYNEGAPLFADVVAFMASRDFVLFDIGDHHVINGVLAQVDLFFCAKDSPYVKKDFL